MVSQLFLSQHKNRDKTTQSFARLKLGLQKRNRIIGANFQKGKSRDISSFHSRTDYNRCYL